MVLLVDDNPKVLEAAEQMLDCRRGLYFASSPKQARELMGLIGADVSVVLIDLDLRSEDAFSFIGEMRRNYPDLPVIAISGDFQKRSLQRARVMGATVALSTPVTADWNAAIARARGRAAHA